MKFLRLSLSLLLIAALSQNPLIAQKKALTLTDVMKFRQIESASISANGKWVAHAAIPDRGDPDIYVYSSDGRKTHHLEVAHRPVISRDGKWVAAIKPVPAVEQMKEKNEKNKSRQGLILLNTATGETEQFKRVQSFAFTNDSKWLIYHNYRENNSNGNKETQGPDLDHFPGDEEKPEQRRQTGSDLHLVSLERQSIVSWSFVKDYAPDSLSRYLAFTIADTTGEGNGLEIADLNEITRDPVPALTGQDIWADHLCWNDRTGQLAFLGGTLNEKEARNEASLYLWSPGTFNAAESLTDEALREGWRIYHKNRLTWSLDGHRLFLGIKPASEIALLQDEEAEDRDSIPPDPFDMEALLEKVELDVWHWDDDLIQPHQKNRWDSEKDRTYTGIYDPGKDRFVQLADESMPHLSRTNNPNVALGSSWLPYGKLITWEGRYNDIYTVDLNTGERTLRIEKHNGYIILSPDGKYLVYYQDANWHLLETASGKTRNLTRDLPVSFANEDHDYPRPAPGYGIGGWIESSEAVLIYDKYDIWRFNTSGGPPTNLTRGRAKELVFRIIRLRPDFQYFKEGEYCLLTAYHDRDKYSAFYRMSAGRSGVEKLLDGPAEYSFRGKALEADRILFTRERYTEFPDLWVSKQDFKKPRRLSDVNPQVSEFAWGEAELVEFDNADGIPLQGVLIKPGNYEPGKKYPVLVYFYRIMSDRLHEFTDMVINHRPNFPYLASNGYAIFLPDIKFEVGRPGFSATKCLVPGVQKLIDLGIADPDAICLHGHSWSGYQAAFVITQTDLFACAIAGAPVSNMTSAYSGIRLESGLARLFQYEQTQSRLGASLWERRDLYIDNSPVFFADRINTPLLIQFGDVDGAVPWQQGIELYLAMRRLEKDCVFLQYRGEPHHLQKYPNKLDYTIKFKEYMDHYLKGAPAPEWLSTGMPYQGK